MFINLSFSRLKTLLYSIQYIEYTYSGVLGLYVQYSKIRFEKFKRIKQIFKLHLKNNKKEAKIFAKKYACEHLKGVFAKNVKGYRLTAENKRF